MSFAYRDLRIELDTQIDTQLNVLILRIARQLSTIAYELSHQRTTSNRNNQTATKGNTHVVWKEHRMNVESWYDGNKSETSDMLQIDRS